MPAASTFFQTALLGMLASGFLAVLGSGQLDLLTVIVMTAAICARALMVAGMLPVLTAPAIISVIAMGLYAADLQWLSRTFVGATVHLTFYVAVVKLLTANTRRDFLYLEIIAGLEMLAAALLSNDGNFFIFLAMFLLFMLGAFSGGEIVRSMETGATVSRVRPAALTGRLSVLSTGLLVGILILTAGLFFVLPRTARAAFQRWAPSGYHVPGFANEVTLGDIGELKLNSSPVMHVRSEEGYPLDGLHWRGSALGRFDGTRWYNPPEREERVPVIQGTVILPDPDHLRGRSLRYSVELGEIASDVMLFAGTPQTIRVQAPLLFRSSSQALRVPRYGASLLQYAVYSRMDRVPGDGVVPLEETQRQGLLTLPALNPKIAELARTWARGASGPEAEARAMEAHFHRDFKYTLQMLDKPVADPLAHFLFERKAGHCEYFASAMAVMLRTVGIPSRVATGFYGGVYNSISGWQILRASDAHSWVEGWIPGKGWVLFDPTPSDPTAVDEAGLLQSASLWMDAAGQFWRDWVLSYDRDHQLVLAARVQNARQSWTFRGWPQWTEVRWPSWQGALPWLAGAAFVAGLLWRGRAWIAGVRQWLLLRRVRRGTGWHGVEASIVYERMLAVLEQRGIRRAPWMTPQEFARTLPASDLALLVQDLTNAYNQVRFGGEQEPAARMVTLLERIEALP